MRLLQTTRMAALALATALLATACGGGTTTEDETTPAGGDTSAATEGEAVSIGITQIVAHPSLDASAQGFKDALADAGYDVTYDEQNAQGDQSTAASIAGTFASADLDLILAIATPTA
ncbi:MAG: sugar ABC transporter substrate-binding protein, partial [Actinomycetes bacterium]|nr:sugar ABC transporter substrate-binding protein [Actinomycetes bacterium]MDX5380015.1 sugar ABC transporter substrate-binding protein [Actinomycetes bacterium]MDX5398561.1 sugar ABC transporter substrate-binding protein [Actinomycetes bacterium]MDX5449715.1 sugar ABC transporter substrate-binding protein [Actinomycetes bacterium]